MRIPHNNTWLVVTFNQPCVFNRDGQESWLLNPMRRYVFAAHHLAGMEDKIASMSDLKGSSHYRPFGAGKPLTGATFLVERFRSRGIGDLLFMTGPFAYLHHLTTGQIGIDTYCFTDRGQVFLKNPQLRYSTPLAGPTHYDDLPLYSYHWFIEAVTEYDEEPDQLNVYDSLFNQLGFDPKEVDPRFKRPFMTVSQEELVDLEQFYAMIWHERNLDLRKTGYYVIAPFTHAPTRTMSYVKWLKVIEQLAKRRPVLVMGAVKGHVADAEISAGEFLSHVQKMGENVIDATDSSERPNKSLRTCAAIVSKANCVFSLDTGLLYVAQALNVPVVSIWGPHDPGVRIGYAQSYMDLAIWTPQECRYAPCFTYTGFPVKKCPNGEHQKTCAVFNGVTVDAVMAKLELVEGHQYKVGPFSPAP